MRTLLNEILPPQCTDQPVFSQTEPATPGQRIFSQNPVLANLDNLAEVGLGKVVKATPSAGAEEAGPALERGVAILGASDLHFEGSERAGSKSVEAKETTLAV
jgi:hypothetical protein